MSDDDLGQPLILTVAPNGARKTQADHPALPMTAAEIARTAAACAEAGAAMIHLHVRDKAGAHLLDAEAYREATAAIRQEAGRDIVVQITTEAVGRYAPGQQMAVVRETEPEAVSLALREFCPDAAAEPAAGEFFAWLQARGTFAQYILYSDEEVLRFDDLIRRGVIPDGPRFVLFVLGRYT
nr:3-keto-5-aminohexanoate cleavage protein [Kiloniellales bacterium]